MEPGSINVNTAIIGGGPAGTGTILKSMKDGTFDRYAENGLALIESSHQLLAGSIRHYQVGSDTLSDVFLECLEGETGRYLKLNELYKEIQFIRNYGGRSIPLSQLSGYLSGLGSLLENYLKDHPNCNLFLNTKASKIIKFDNGSFQIFLSDGKQIFCNNILMAMGASPVDSFAPGFRFANEIKLDLYQKKSITSDELIKRSTTDSLLHVPANEPKIIILGGNHSAFSAADHLLNQKKYTFKNHGINIWATKKPVIFYQTKNEAINDGYTDFTDEDICTVTNRLYRLAGLRMNGKNLYKSMLGFGKTTIEKRVILTIFENQTAKIINDLAEADLIVHALGYRFNTIPIYNEKKDLLEFIGSKTKHWVNNNCQMIDTNGNAVKNLFATGLGTGYIPSKNSGGESSFKGQTNGFWYYQNNTADIILKNIMSRH